MMNFHHKRDVEREKEKEEEKNGGNKSVSHSCGMNKKSYSKK